VRDPSDQPKSVPTLARELWELVVAYARQETLEPIKDLGRFVALGLAGAAVLTIGLVFLFLAGLRALQTETGAAFTGRWSWVPYAITLVVAGALAGAVMAARNRGQKQRRGRP
jgi:hypothetical protein